MKIIIITLAILIIAIVMMYNFLVRKKNQVDNIYSNVEVILKKRYDLLPNLFRVTEAIMKHERALFSEVASLRSEALNAKDTDLKLKLDSKLSNPLNGILVAIENYPELKSNKNVLHLQASLVEIEEQISAARRAYNQSVTDYNNAIEMIPTNILAKFLGYKQRDLYQAPSVILTTQAKDLLKK
ncbi:MAG: LemA family protein [Campylobacteraceae bacterium]